MKDIELFNDHFQNFKAYGIPKAQLIIADVPYNLGANAYASNPAWYVDGDNKNGESALAGKQFFDTDKDFRLIPLGWGYIRGYAAPQYEKAVKGTGGNPGTGKKSVEAVAKEVIAGKWGNGEDRKKRLQAAGYDYPAVQAKVNELVKSKVYGSRNERTSCKAVG